MPGHGHSSRIEPPRALSRYLLLGGIERQFSSRICSPLPLVLAKLPAEGAAVYASEYLQGHDLVASDLTVIPTDGPVVRISGPVPVWEGLSQGRELGVVIADHVGTRPDDKHRFAPLLLLRNLGSSATGHLADVLTCTRIREIGLVFTRVGSVAQSPDTGAREHAHAALSVAQSWNEQIAGEAHQYVNFEPESEVEAKVTVESPVSPWDIAGHFAALVKHRKLDGFIPDVGNEFQRWQHHQYTFEITHPVEQAGYFAFLPKPNGSYLLKHKTFAHDALRRREVFKFDISLPGDQDFAEYLAATFPELRTRRLPHLIRSRFDVNVESTQTGHFYGIEVDEVLAEGYPRTLRQVEIEYHHSRRHEGLNSHLIEDEVLGLQAQVQRELARIGVKSEANFYSKLSFLQDIVGASSKEADMPV